MTQSKREEHPPRVWIKGNVPHPSSEIRSYRTWATNFPEDGATEYCAVSEHLSARAKDAKRIDELQKELKIQDDANEILTRDLAAEREKVEMLNKEVQEQARLNGMGSEREARLMARIEELKKDLATERERTQKLLGELGKVREALDKIADIGITTFEEEPAYNHQSVLAREALALLDGIAREREIYREGRNSVRESMVVMARALDKISSATLLVRARELALEAQAAIAQVKARGDWPLENK